MSHDARVIAHLARFSLDSTPDAEQANPNRTEDDDMGDTATTYGPENVLDCGHTPSPHGDITTGYGKDDKGLTYCYACCAERDREQMVRDGRATLYLSKDDGRYVVSNWPGSLRFPVRHVKIGAHNMAETVTTAYFTGPNGAAWSARCVGNNTQIAHCRQLKGGR